MLSLITSAFSSITGLFSNTWVKLIVVAILCGLIVVLGFLLKQETERAAVMEDRYFAALAESERLVMIMEGNAKAAAEEVAKLKADLVLSAQVSRERQASNKKLSRQIARLQRIERPEHEKSCPVHPAITAAFDIMRGETAKDDLRAEGGDPRSNTAAGTASLLGSPTATDQLGW